MFLSNFPEAVFGLLQCSESAHEPAPVDLGRLARRLARDGVVDCPQRSDQVGLLVQQFGPHPVRPEEVGVVCQQFFVYCRRVAPLRPWSDSALAYSSFRMGASGSSAIARSNRGSDFSGSPNAPSTMSAYHWNPVA